MKLLRLWALLLLCLPQILAAQQNAAAVVDTVETSEGPVVLFKNNTWEYLKDEPILMSIWEDSTGVFSTSWLTDQVFARRVSPDSIGDTVVSLVTAERIFTMPAYGKLWRGFTYSHKGLDIQLQKGDPVKAAFDGVVRYAKYNRGGFGYLVILRHYNGLETYYSHLSRIDVKVNQVVSSGEILGLGGSTGRSRGPHLHFEVRYRDVPIDPLRLIDYDGQRLVADTFQIAKQVFYPNDHIAGAVYIKIKSGDTLGKLSKRYGTSVREICAMNKITPTTTLRIGKSIRVR